MKNIILLVQSEEQAKALPAAGRVIGRLGPIGLWVLYSPILSIDATAATKELDAEVTAMEKAERSAAAVGDYETAKARRADRDKAMLNRSVAVRNAWKNVLPGDRKKHAARFLDPFLCAANPENTPKPGWRLNQLPEHQDAEHWITTLNELRGTWHVDMKPGEFMVTWPSQLLGLEAFGSFVQPPSPANRFFAEDPTKPRPASVQPKVPIPPTTFDAAARRAQLATFHGKKIIAVARPRGIKTKDKTLGAIIDEIIAAETAKAIASL